jgi:predicted thioesterase
LNRRVLEPGRTATAVLVVGPADTATSLGSGDVDVLGTPRVVALCEQATVAAVTAALPAGHTTVGVRVELDHLRPSYVGSTVTARATLAGVDGNRLRFDVDVVDGDAVVARGQVVRAVVDAARFATGHTPNVERG